MTKKKLRISLTIDPKLKAILESQSIQQDRSISWIVNDILGRWAINHNLHPAIEIKSSCVAFQETSNSQSASTSQQR